MRKHIAGKFLFGAGGYAAIEVLWRGYTHWTMALTGGTVYVALSRLKKKFRAESAFSRCLCGAACITAAEYVVGCTVNRRYHMDVWDYKEERGNLQGQICPKYAALWFILSAPIMLAQA